MNRIRTFALLAGALLSFSACNTDNTLYYNITEMGNIRDGKIVSDSGLTFTITEMTEQYSLEGLDRVIFLADVLESTGEMAYNIRLKSLFKVPSPDIVKAADFVEPTEESADRPARIQTAWFGGEYINFNIAYLVNDGSKVEHNFTLAEQTVPDGKDTLFLRLFHDAGAEDEHWDGSADLELSGLGLQTVYYSFPIKSFATTGDTPRPVKVFYRWYHTEDGEVMPSTELYFLKGELE